VIHIIEREQIIELLKTYLPNANTTTLSRLTDDVIQNIIPAIHAMLQQTAAAEKRKL
jgi:hypothetical protein